MNRRQFVSRVSLGAAAACTTFAKPSLAAAISSKVNVRFVGMMTFVERSDRSFLVATPGQHALHHMTHVPFLMARAGSARSPRPSAWCRRQASCRRPSTPSSSTPTPASSSTAISTTPRSRSSRARRRGVESRDQMAQLQKIAPGKRVRGNIEKWASTTVSLRGGRIENSPGHPDAGKVWSFGDYQQRLTDAVNFQARQHSRRFA